LTILPNSDHNTIKNLQNQNFHCKLNPNILKLHFLVSNCELIYEKTKINLNLDNFEEFFYKDEDEEAKLDITDNTQTTDLTLKRGKSKATINAVCNKRLSEIFDFNSEMRFKMKLESIEENFFRLIQNVKVKNEQSELLKIIHNVKFDEFMTSENYCHIFFMLEKLVRSHSIKK